MWRLVSSREKKKNRNGPSLNTVGLTLGAASTHQKDWWGRS
jgi:hypothetical protein